MVTGTGTGVGKTVATAAIAALALARGDRVAVVKPAQTGTGVPGGAGGAGVPAAVGAGVPAAAGADIPDCQAIGELSGVTDLHELARFPDPLSPEAAARTAGLPPLDMRAAAGFIAGLAQSRDLVLVEGAGGLLVRYDAAGATIADLASALDAPAVVVAAAALGTLNHTALTCEALAARRIRCGGVVIGSWPRHPGLAERANLADLEVIVGEPLAGALPEDSGRLGREDFLTVARAGLGPRLGGTGPAVPARHRPGGRGEALTREMTPSAGRRGGRAFEDD